MAREKQDIKQVIIIRKDLKMGTGKIAAQACHASLMSYMEAEKKYKDIVESWLSEGGTKVVVKVNTIEEFDDMKKKLRASGLPFKVVKDAGQTQVLPGTETAIGIGPYYTSDIDKVTSKLSLL
ncbi:peptidyl-tRNA hydrolase Pth2 [Candidatus Parvarchaeota archaeon]|nr:peptidyl-tRNA hydrolase Pth2 [Candidatus Parvarchaeota archaeon]